MRTLQASRAGATGCRHDRRHLVLALAVLLGAGAVAAAPAEAQPLAAITGVWQGQETGPLGVMDVDAIFFPNGTYRRTHRWGDLVTWDAGSFSVVQTWIHFELRTYGPTIYKGQPLSRPMSDTWVVQQFDGRFLRATVGGASTVAVRRTS